ncbi:universal stress protein [Halapricum sp. CBA1109]|jgi:nucleotide-binding universal stress UspA family protein|uniref:universal stress protein n=1 Tax=Halapricum sp. CBA1109 TaxID=2668068 RepID=UPI0012FCD1D7|nr:universal stress protein [Halapricum sp. CBA1109]MUV90834.1 universal stress protein [Halapricum sp. CBA1109]
MALETVVVAVGPTEERRVDQLTETVLDVAGPHDATVVLFHAFTESAFEDGIEQYEEDPEDPPTPAEMTRRLESVARMMAELEAAGLSYEIESDIVDPKDGILAAVEDAEADMLFVGGRKRSTLGKALAGNTAHQVMMNAGCPVVFVRQEIADEE